MQKQPSPRKSYKDKGPLRRRLAFVVCWFRGNHPFIELSRAHVELVEGSPRQVFVRNKLVCRECGYET